MAEGVVRSWRDRIKVHPATDLFPMLADDRFAALIKDIQRFGVRSPLVFWCDCNGERLLLDGRNRIEAASRLGSFDVASNGIRVVLKTGSVMLIPEVEVEGEPHEIVASYNVHRRDLTGRQRRELAAALLTTQPARSDNATAKLAGISDKTVTAVRRELEGRSEIPNVSLRADAAGRQQPATKPSRERRAVASAPAVRAVGNRTGAQKRDQAIADFSILLHAKPVETLGDLGRILRGEAGTIAGIQREKRVAIAQVILAALGVDRNDLQPLA